MSISSFAPSALLPACESLFHTVNTNLECADEVPNYSSSWSTKALIITSIALFAISIVSIALMATLPLTCGLMFGLIAGIVVPFWPAVGAAAFARVNHKSEIRQREFDFAESKKDPTVKLEYYGKAAKKGHKNAIQREFEIGKARLLKTAEEKDEIIRKEKFTEELKVFEKSAKHSIANSAAYQQVHQRSPKLKTNLWNEFNSSVNEQKPVEELIERYWNFIVKDTHKTPFYPAAYIWTPESYSRP